MTPLLPVVAIDGGHVGACVALDETGRRALFAYSWARRKRKGGTVYSLSTAEGALCDRTNLHQVGIEIRNQLDRLQIFRHLLVVEGLFVPRPSSQAAADLARPRRQQRRDGPGAKYLGQVSSVFKLAEAGALVTGPLLSRAVGDVERPLASKWRPAILGLPANCSSDESEALAIRMVTEARPPLVSGLGDLGLNGHVAEAACQARWGHVLLKERANAERAKA